MDPYSVGYLCGSAIAPTLIGYFVGRQLIKSGGDPPGARLQERAGLLEPGAKVPSAWRSLVPPALAVVGSAFGLGVGVVSIAKESQEKDPATLAAGFLNGCQKTCSEANPADVCASYCDCALNEVKRTHPTPESLKTLFDGVAAKDPAAQRELLQTREACAPRQTQ